MTILLVLIIISGFDQDLTEGIINSFPKSTAILLFRSLSNSANIEVVGTGMTIYSIIGGEEAFKNSEVISVGGFVTGLTVSGIKYIVNRKRPDGSHNRFNSSFPSGHTATAFLIAEFMSVKYPAFRPLLYSWAVGVGLSRIYLRRHWPTDVFFGGILGIFFARISIKYQDRILRILNL
jgi:membrane-associated phospholipid phosphatase